MSINALQAGLIGSGINALGSIGSGIISNAANRTQSSRAFARDIHAWHWQNQRDDFLWNRQNEYNSPSAQMKRLKEAGLNPNLIYGSSPANAAGQAMTPGRSGPPQAKAAQQSWINPFQGIEQFADFKLKQAQVDNLEQQTKVAAAEELYKLQATANQKLVGKKHQYDVDEREATFQTSVDAAKARLDILKQQARSAKTKADLDEATKQDQIDEVEVRLQIAKNTRDLRAFEAAIKAEEVWMIQNGIRPQDAFWHRLLAGMFEPDRIREWITNFEERYNEFWRPR